MTTVTRIILVFLSVIYTVKAIASTELMEQTARGLIERTTPNLADKFIISIKEGDSDFFEISQASEGRVQLSGSDGIAIASAYHHYLRYYLHSSITWAGDNLRLTTDIKTLPKLTQTIRKDRYKKWSYYFNTCTFSYSTVWWNWEQWEKHIDWIATRGINMPLMFVGQEYIWVKTFKKFGLELKDFDSFFTGPTFLAWQRMGNFRGFGGPLSSTWMVEQFYLGKKIYDRMRAFGMKPILPAFAGHVPERFETKYSGISRSDSILTRTFPKEQCCVRFIEPDNPLFLEVGTQFIQTLIDHFGETDHLYNGDLYNEMMPASDDVNYLRDVAKVMIDSMRAADPEAVWIIQGWAFYHAKHIWKPPQIQSHLDAVDNEHMLILDLWSEVNPQWTHTNSFYGKPYIWCELLNFGGAPGMYGRMKTVMHQPYIDDKISSMSGIGIAPEGLFTNEIMFDMHLDHAWQQEPVDIKEWVKDYIKARYGGPNIHAERAWDIFSDTAFNAPAIRQPKARIVRRPSMWPVRAYYDHCRFLDGWEDILKAGPAFIKVEPFRFDLIDITRQALSNLFEDYHITTRNAFRSSDLCTVEAHKPLMLGLLEDMDSYLATDERNMLGLWLEEAEKWARNEVDLERYRYGAKNIVSMWGPIAQLRDYGARQWNGLVKDYYLRRWDLWFDYVLGAMRSHTPYDEAAFEAECFLHEERWGLDHDKVYPSRPIGDLWEETQWIYEKYGTQARALCQATPVTDEG
mmetsp:Transcript_47981/g.55291  ORF Transcript_47981/g.55291 Transcript_47981/m.55291 type:complete len:742 (-) Transcript_47981:163-2388(-)